MSTSKKTREEAPSSFVEKVDAALRLAVADVIEEHRRSGRPLVVSKDGKVVLLPPDQVSVPKTCLQNSKRRKKEKKT